MAGSKKINKAKAREPKTKDVIVVNNYAVIADMDGNPNSPQEFDESHHDEGELYFKADEDATERRKNEVLMLNFIHQELHHVTERKVPVLNTETDNPNLDVYHRVKFQGVELDVCVFWPHPVEGDYKCCMAMVKLTSDDLSDERGEVGTISTDAAWNADSKGDSFTMKNDKLVKNYWAPRWKYLVNALRTVAYFCYDRNGERKPKATEEDEEHDNDGGDAESQEEREEPMSIFSGASGKIIGPKGAKIQEIKTTAGVKDIKMPAKNEDGTRPKARELVELTITGKPRAIEKARELIQEILDEWANAPRPPRDGGGSGGYGSGDFHAQSNDFTGGGEGGGDNFGGGDTWNNPPAGGGDWDTNSAGGGRAGCGDTEWGAAPAGKKSEW